jgi:hypothetical protein
MPRCAKINAICFSSLLMRFMLPFQCAYPHLIFGGRGGRTGIVELFVAVLYGGHQAVHPDVATSRQVPGGLDCELGNVFGHALYPVE